MPDIGENEVMDFWRGQMSNKWVRKKLKNLFKRSTTAGITESRDNLPIQNELEDRLADCLTKQFGNEDFVILKYGSWIYGCLEDQDPNNGELEEGFLRYCEQVTLEARPNKIREENGKIIFNYANPEQTKDAWAKKYGRECLRPGRDIIAAFSESKIWIGWKEEFEQDLLAGIVHTAGLTPSPCFSWWGIYPDNPPPSNCLAPWKGSQSWVKLKNPENTPALFRELIVRQKGKDFNFLKKSSWNPNLRL